MSANASDKPSHLYLSPHLDDVPFSCAGLIARQRAQDQRVVVVTYFTADSDTELSALAQRFHVVWDRGPQPYAWRRTEDKAAMELLKVEFNHEGMHDAIYRLGGSGKPLYPTMETLFGSVRSDDLKTIESIAVSIKHWIEALILDPSFLYIPVGISRSVDHQVVVLAAKRALEGSRIALKLYEEFPYATGYFPRERPVSVDQGLSQFEQLTEVVAGVLAATIAVEDQPCLPAWVACEPSHIQSIQHQLAMHIRPHRPAHHFAAEQIDHDGKKQPTFCGRDVSQIAHPHLDGRPLP